MDAHPTRSLFLVSLGHMSVELCSQFLPVLYPVLVTALGLNYTQVGLIAMAAGVGTSLAQPLFGYLSDLWYPRWIVVLGIVWVGLIMSIVGLLDDYASVVLVVGLGVLGSAAFHPAAASIASSGGGTRRGIATSIFSVGGSLGTVLSPLWMTAGLSWMGKKGTLVLAPVALLVGALLLAQLGRVPRLPKSQTQDRQQSLNRRTVLGLALVVLAVMCLSWFQGAFRTYLPIWIQSRGGSEVVAGRMFTVFVAGMSLGNLAGGALSDRVGRWVMLVCSLGLLWPVSWLFIGSTGALEVMLLGAIGVLVGATFPVSIVMAQETWPQGRGIASGLVMGLGWVPSGLGASLTGLLADRYSLATGLRSLALPVALGTVCVLAYAFMRRSPPERT